MATTEERMKVLQMLQEGKLGAEEAAQLLQAIEEEPQRASEAIVVPAEPGRQPTTHAEVLSGRRPHWLRVRVTSMETGRPKVNMRLPISLVNVGLKLGSKFAPEIEGMDFEEMIRAVDTGETGTFVDVTDEEDGERVEVFLE